MARQRRIIVAGELFHVTQRGNYRQDVFTDNIDRAYYLKLLEKYKNEYGLELYAFCLMNNHVHLIVKPLSVEALSNTICRCHQRYAYYLHKKKGVQGHLWKESFYSCLLQGEHILRAIRYVERNPVRAGMVKEPWEYVWSSARAHLGVRYQAITLADHSAICGDLDWRSFISEKDEEGHIKRLREQTFRSSALGSTEELALLELRIGRKIIPIQGRPKKVVRGTTFA